MPTITVKDDTQIHGRSRRMVLREFIRKSDRLPLRDAPQCEHDNSHALQYP